MNRINFPFNLRNSMPVITVVCFLVILSFSAVFLYPQYQNLNQLQKNIKAKKAEFQQQEEYFASLSQNKTELEQYKEELAKINSALSDDPSLPSLFGFIAEASSQSGLVLKGISPFTISLLSSEESQNMKATQFSLEVAGDYSSFKNFISTLETSSRIIEVESISFSSPQEGDLFTFRLGIKVYSY